MKSVNRERQALVRGLFSGVITGVLNNGYWVLSFYSSLIYFFYNGQLWSGSSCQMSMVIPLDIIFEVLDSEPKACFAVLTPVNPLELIWFVILRSYVWVLLLPLVPWMIGRRVYVKTRRK